MKEIKKAQKEATNEYTGKTRAFHLTEYDTKTQT